MIDDSEFISFFSRNPAMSDQVSSRMVSVFCDKALMPSVVVCLAGLLIGLWFQIPPVWLGLLFQLLYVWLIHGVVFKV